MLLVLPGPRNLKSIEQGKQRLLNWFSSTLTSNQLGVGISESIILVVDCLPSPFEQYDNRCGAYHVIPRIG